MSEFWLVVHGDGAVEKEFSCKNATARYGWLKQEGSSQPYSILHFVNGIPHDVTPGREKPEDDRLAKIEERLAILQDHMVKAENNILGIGGATERVANIDDRLDTMRTNIQGINGTLEAQDRRLAILDDRTGATSAAVVAGQSAVTSIAERLSHVQAEADCLRHENAEIARRLAEHDRRLNDQSEIIHDLADDAAKAWAEIPALKRRLDALSNRLAEFDPGANPTLKPEPLDNLDMNGTDRDANPIKPEPSSGAEAVYRVATKNPWSDADEEDREWGRKVYRAAVAHYRKTVPHLTLGELRGNIGTGYDGIDRAIKEYDRIAANRKEPK